MPAIIQANIESKILLVRGQKVMLDHDLAKLYGVTVSRLNEQVSRNIFRFPEDFRFRLIAEEFRDLKSQIAISKKGRGGRRNFPVAFTEQGIAMLSSVLKSRRAVQVNIGIMRTFVKLRDLLRSNVELARKLDRLEKNYDSQFRIVFDAIRKLMHPPKKRRKSIGFQ